MIRKTLWLLLFFLLCKTMVYAQLSMGNPREKFSMTASIDGVANSSYTWDTDNNQDVADGRMTRQMNVKLRSSIKLVSGLMGSVSIQPFYNYNTTRLNTDWREGTEHNEEEQVEQGEQIEQLEDEDEENIEQMNVIVRVIK